MSSPGGAPRSGRRDLARQASVATIAVALLLGSYWRLAHVGDALLFGDEFHSLRELRRSYAELVSSFGAQGSGMALPLLQRALVDLFGTNHWSLRAPAYAASLATLLCTAWFGWLLWGPVPAAIATALLAASSIQIYYAHFGRAYALMSLLSLLLVVLLQRAVDRGRASRTTCAAGAGLAALLPYVHLAAAGAVVLVFAAAALAFAVRGRRRDALAMAATLALGGAAAGLLHLPAWSSLRAYVAANRSREYFGDFGVLDVLTVVAGSRSGAAVGTALVAVAVVALLWRRGAGGLPLVAGCLGPAASVVALRPYGDAYAYARYGCAAVPVACLIVGWWIHAVAVRLAGPRQAGALAALAAGIGLAFLLYAAGPYGLRHTPDGPHANTYLSLYPLPLFDRPWPEAPAFYRQLARDPRPLRIIEAPALTSRARHLYRNYYLLHRKQTLLALFPDELPGSPPAGPYVSLYDSDWRDRADADYLILHTDVRDESLRYGAFVYGDPAWSEPSVVAFMTRHSRYALDARPPSPYLLQRLETTLGPPLYTDRHIRVWNLRKSGGRAVSRRRTEFSGQAGGRAVSRRRTEFRRTACA